MGSGAPLVGVGKGCRLAAAEGEEGVPRGFAEARHSGTRVSRGRQFGQNFWGSGGGKARDFAPLTWQAAPGSFRSRPRFPTRLLGAG